MADGKLIIETKIDNKTFEEQINQTKAELERLEQNFKDVANMNVFEGQEEDLKELKLQIEKTSNKLTDLTQKQAALDGLGKSGEKAGDKTSKGFQKGASSLKRFALAIFSIQSIYALVSKASTSYLEQDIVLAEKLRNVWVGLGSFLSPAIEKISNVLLKGLGYLNEFIKALTGIDYIARANAKSLDKQAQAQRNLNNQTYDFDVIRKQQEQISGITTPTGLITTPVLDMNVVKKLQSLAFWLKENQTLIKQVGISLGITFGAVTIGKMIASIAGLIGSTGIGLVGLSALLLAIANVFVISLVLQGYDEVYKQIQEVNKLLQNNIDETQNLANKQVSLSEAFWDLVESGKATTKQVQDYIKYSDKQTTSIANQIIELEKQKTWLGAIFGGNKKITEQQYYLSQNLNVVNQDYQKLYEQGMLNDNQIKDYMKSLNDEISVLGQLGYNVKDLKNKYEELSTGTYNPKVTATLNDKVSKAFDDLLNKYKNVSIRIGSSGTLHTGRGSKAFASGGIVTQPTRALIGEAGYPEAVVPMTADYLGTLAQAISKYGNSSGGTVNVYLDGRLIQRQIAETTNKKQFATNG